MGGLFAIMALIGAASVTIFPLGLELAMEVTRNAGSSAVLWFMSVPVFAFLLLSLVTVEVLCGARWGMDEHKCADVLNCLVYAGEIWSAYRAFSVRGSVGIVDGGIG